MAARARQPRKDQAQEAVMRRKDVLNERTSLLVQLLLNSKRGWNGRPVPDLGIPGSRLTEPLPEAIMGAAQRINQLSDEIVTRINDLVRAQGEYASSKMTPVQRQAALIQLQKEASWVGSRLWFYLTTPFKLGDKDRWKRLSMLRSAADLYNMLKEIDGHILGGVDEIPLAVQKVLRFSSVLNNDLVAPIGSDIAPELESLTKKLEEAKAKSKGREGKERPLQSYVGRWVRKTIKTDTGEEDVWVSVTAVKGDKLVGRVAEDAESVGLKKGDEIELTPEEVSKEFSRAVPKTPKPKEPKPPKEPKEPPKHKIGPLSTYIGRYVEVKVTDEDQEENVFVAVTEKSGDQLVGTVEDDAKILPLKAGEQIVFDPSQIQSVHPTKVPTKKEEGKRPSSEAMRDELLTYWGRLKRAYQRLSAVVPKFSNQKNVVNSVQHIGRLIERYQQYYYAFIKAWGTNESGAAYIAYLPAKALYEQIQGQILQLTETWEDARAYAAILVGKGETEEQEETTPVVEEETQPPPVEEEPQMTPEEAERHRIMQELQESMEADVGDAMDKMAANMLGRWLSRQKTKYFGGKTKGLKLEADRHVVDTMKALNRLMDSLEKSQVPGNELIDRLQSVARQVTLMVPAIQQVALEYDRVVKERKATGHKGTRLDVRDYRLLNDAVTKAKTFSTNVDSYRQKAGELAKIEGKANVRSDLH